MCSGLILVSPNYKPILGNLVLGADPSQTNDIRGRLVRKLNPSDRPHR